MPFARNIRSAEQVNELLLALRETVGSHIMLSVDQEGGTVDRLRRIIEPFPAADKIRNAEDAREHGALIGRALRLLGFNMNFAPVVDVATDERRANNNGLRGRSFGNSAEEVVDLAGSFLNAMQAEGIAACLKHFPGLAAATVDSHEELPVVPIGEEEFGSIDLHPYRRLLTDFDVRFVMVAHAVYPELALQELDRSGRLLPSSLSSLVVNKLLKEEFGFSGVAITDDLLMGAITRDYGLPEACLMAINAGEDMLAICSEPELIVRSYDHLEAGLENGELSRAHFDASIERIDRIASTLAEPIKFDESEFDELSAKIVDFKARLQ
ncbi:MAG: hypothetical protein IPM21_17100 [Acidobacteria bacterium]|nr:hypothetical protein [Acidobacteriota bacterium]